jgi:hypothetical protein
VRHSKIARLMSEMGHFRKFWPPISTSGFRAKGDIVQKPADFRV